MFQGIGADDLGPYADRFRALLDTIPQMAWSTNIAGHADYFNARWVEFTGVAALTTDTTVRRNLIHPDDRQQTVEIWEACQKTGVPFEIEFRLRHHSGDYRWTLCRAMPLRDDDGKILRWIGTCTDVDDLKQAEEARELITAELAHRIKNIFAVVSSLVSLSARDHPEAAAFAATINSRISALGRANDYVRPHSSASAHTGGNRLHGLIGALIEPYQDAGAGRIVIQGDNAAVGARAATAIALVLHELATNAVKYGALSRPSGSVTIQSTISDGQLTLSWTEHGGPAVQGVPDRQGFGTQMAQRAAQAQLRATITNDWREGGLATTMVMPTDMLDR